MRNCNKLWLAWFTREKETGSVSAAAAVYGIFDLTRSFRIYSFPMGSFPSSLQMPFRLEKWHHNGKADYIWIKTPSRNNNHFQHFFKLLKKLKYLQFSHRY